MNYKSIIHDLQNEVSNVGFGKSHKKPNIQSPENEAFTFKNALIEKFLNIKPAKEPKQIAPDSAEQIFTKALYAPNKNATTTPDYLSEYVMAPNSPSEIAFANPFDYSIAQTNVPAAVIPNDINSTIVASPALPDKTPGYEAVSYNPSATIMEASPIGHIDASATTTAKFKVSVADLSVAPIMAKQSPAAVADLSADVALSGIGRNIQGHNECGPTSLSNVLAYYGVTANPHTMFPSSTFGHEPMELIEVAQNYGMTVRQENNGSLDDLARMVDAGLPPLVLGINGGGDNIFADGEINNLVSNVSRGHWMTVAGYVRDSSGRITHVYVQDPNFAQSRRMSASEFLTFWDNNLIPGGHHYYMSMAPAGSYQQAALLAQLPTDQIDSGFAITMDIAHYTVAAAYAAEDLWTSVADAVTDVATSIADRTEDVATSVADEISSWFS